MHYLCVIVATVIATTVLAEDRGKVHLQSGVSLMLSTASKHLDAGFGVCGHFCVAIPVGPQVALLFRSSGTWHFANTKAYRMSKGSFSCLAVEESILLSFTSPVVRPYFGGGAGYYILNHDIDKTLESILNALGLYVQEDLSNVFGGHIRGGLAVHVGSHVALAFDARYMFIRPALDVRVADIVTFDTYYQREYINLSGLMLSAGITLIFGGS